MTACLAAHKGARRGRRNNASKVDSTTVGSGGGKSMSHDTVTKPSATTGGSCGAPPLDAP